MKKIKNRISCRRFKWLSIGGKLTLKKIVLESIQVYWLSLAQVPKGILDAIRKSCFSFLWKRNKKKEGILLVNWKRLVKLKKNGRWGMKNVFMFGKALVAKSL